MSKSQIISQEKADRFLRMFPPRMKQLDKQIQLVQNCSRKDGYEWGFTDTVPIFFIVIFNKLTICAKKFGLDVVVRIEGRDIEEVYEDANDKFLEKINGD
tara:strand:+ start:719 stop:1018 length:300 start_codon:yes stop_codon:yes gene_type:complete